MRTILKNEVSTRKLEFATLLSVNGTVLVNAGSKNRTYDTGFDPNGIVTKLRAAPKAGQIRTSKVRAMCNGRNQVFELIRTALRNARPKAGQVSASGP